MLKLLGLLHLYEFVAALYMFSDVFNALGMLVSRLSERKKDIDYTMVKPLVVGTKAAVDALLLNTGECFQSLPAAVGDLQQYGVQQPSGSMENIWVP